MSFADVLAKVPHTVRIVVSVILAAVVIYGIGYCYGNEHGAASERVKYLEQRNDSLSSVIDKMDQQRVEDKKKFDEAISAAYRDVEDRKDLTDTVQVIAPGKIKLITIDGPKVIQLDGAITRLIIQDSIVIAQQQEALKKAEIYINTLESQLVAEKLLADNNYLLYETQKKVKHNGKNVVIFLIGVTAGVLSAAFAK